MVDRPFFTWKGKICGPILLWSNLAHLGPTLGRSQHCSFICLTLTLLYVYPRAGAVVLGMASIVAQSYALALQFPHRFHLLLM